MSKKSEILKDTIYLFGWKSCPLCGKNVEMVRRRQHHRNGRVEVKVTEVLVFRHKICPHCGEKYKVANAGAFYVSSYQQCPDGCMMLIKENNQNFRAERV